MRDANDVAGLKKILLKRMEFGTAGRSEIKSQNRNKCNKLVVYSFCISTKLKVCEQEWVQETLK